MLFNEGVEKLAVILWVDINQKCSSAWAVSEEGGQVRSRGQMMGNFPFYGSDGLECLNGLLTFLSLRDYIGRSSGMLE